MTAADSDRNDPYMPPHETGADKDRTIQDAAFSNAILTTGIGLGLGVAASVILFKRRIWPVWFGLGFGIGRGYSEGHYILKSQGAYIVPPKSVWSSNSK